MSTTRFFKGDQFVGYKVDPTTGDLVLRFIVARTDIPDANGRGITRRVMESNRNIAKGRPLIFAPSETQGGTRGHTNTLAGVDPYKYELGRIVNLEPVTPQLLKRINENLVQTNSSFRLINDPLELWVVDTIITNDQAKNIFLNPATSHLIPRYVSPSFIHKRNPSGDYSRVDDAVLDHVAIVNKPTFDPNNGIQIDGAAYGEVTKLSGACFGDKVACLNLLQTSSSKVIELDKCVSCPTQLKDRLTNLYKNVVGMFQIVQSSSDIIMSSNNNNAAEQQTPATNQTTVTTTNPTTNTTTTSTNTSDNNNTPVISNPLSQFFKTDETLQQNYGVLKNLVAQVITENKDSFRNAILVDGNDASNNANNNSNNSMGNNNANNSNNQNPNKQNAENVQSGESPQNQTITQDQYKQVLDKLNLKEDEVKNMRTEDIVKRFGDIKGVIQQVLTEQERANKTLEQIRTKEQKSKIANMLPREAFQDDRGFKQKEFDEVVSYLHKKQIDDQYIAIFGVGLATLKNEQLKIKEQQINLKNNKLPQGFGDSIKQKQAQQQANNNNNNNESNTSDPLASLISANTNTTTNN